MRHRTDTAAIEGPSEALESLLREMLAAHERLIETGDQHADAMKRADGDGVQAATERQRQTLQEIATLEQRRREVVASMSRDVRGRAPGAGTLTLTELAAAQPEPQRTRLVELARRLRAIVTAAHEQQRTLRRSATELVAHMDGLMRQVARRVSHAGTYTRRGFVENPVQVMSGLDVVM
jgi:FlgN protein